MDITFQRSKNLHDAAILTFSNMRSYYERYAVDWDAKLIEEKTRDLENYDICFGANIIGIFRLQYENSYCYLRDIQVKPSYQNRGIGQIVLNEVKRLSLKKGLHTVKLRVFKISPAIELYKRNGFITESEDERFLNLETHLLKTNEPNPE